MDPAPVILMAPPPPPSDRSPLLQSTRHVSSTGSSDHQAERNEAGAWLTSPDRLLASRRDQDEGDSMTMLTSLGGSATWWSGRALVPAGGGLHVALQMQTPKGVDFVQVGHRMNLRWDFVLRGVFRALRTTNVVVDMTRLELVLKKRRWLRRNEKVRVIPLFRVREVRAGHTTSNFQRWGKHLDKNLSFSIVYDWNSGRRKVRTDNFVISLPNATVQDRDEVVNMLRDVVDGTRTGRLRPAKRLGSRANTRAAFWENALHMHDRNRDGALSEVELSKLLSFLGAPQPREAASRILEEFDTNADGKLQTDEFVRVLWEWKREPQLLPVFADLCMVRPEDISGPEALVTVTRESLVDFCCRVQGEKEDAARAWVKDMMDKFGVHDATAAGPADAAPAEEPALMDFAGFCDAITSSMYNNAVAQPRGGAQDLTQPLSHYFISSSHNTYLKGDQLVGSSSVTGYVNAYRNGNRCVEVDLWDGSDGKPCITHGMTATERMSFEAFVDVTLTEAFAGGLSTPLIISLENHASPDQQRWAANLMKERFGSLLHEGFLPRLMSPAELGKRILIKASFTQVTEPTLMSLVALLIEPFLGDGGWDEMIRRPPHSMLNIPEKALRKIKLRAKLAEYARTHLVRVYPFGLRIDSSNMDPLEVWSAGCQIAALNVQKPGLALRTNYSLFDPKTGWSLIPPEVPDAAECVCKIRILSGRMLPKTKANAMQVQLRVSKFDHVVAAAAAAAAAATNVATTPTMLSPSTKSAGAAPGDTEDGLASAVIRENPDAGGEDDNDEDEEESLRKVGLFFSSKDVPGQNSMDPQFSTEEFVIRTRSPQTTLVIFAVKTNRKKLCFGGCVLSDLRLGFRALPLVGRRAEDLSNSPSLLVHVSVESSSSS